MSSIPHRRVTLKDLLDEGLLLAGEQLTCEPRKGELYKATLQADGTILYEGKSFRTPSDWAAHVAGSSRNGWRDVHARGEPLEEYRHRLDGENGDRDGGDIETRLLERARSLMPREFELLMREYLWSYGFENVQVTGRSGDGGIDGTFDVPVAELRLGFQAKRWGEGAMVGGPLIRDFRGALVGRRLAAGIFITTSEFTAGAKEEAEQAGPKITLIDGKALAHNLVERGIGIKDVVVEAEIDEDFFRGLGE